jgi:topoisomerase-4 subunit A
MSDDIQSPEDFDPELTPEITQEEEGTRITRVSGMYEDYFLDYASYVILERAVPALNDGLKPVQRRLLHAMKEMDDGRFHKVANIIGQTYALSTRTGMPLLVTPWCKWGRRTY